MAQFCRKNETRVLLQIQVVGVTLQLIARLEELMCCCVKYWCDGKFCLFSQNVEKKGHVCLSILFSKIRKDLRYLFGGMCNSGCVS